MELIHIFEKTIQKEAFWMLQTHIENPLHVKANTLPATLKMFGFTYMQKAHCTDTRHWSVAREIGVFLNQLQTWGLSTVHENSSIIDNFSGNNVAQSKNVLASVQEAIYLNQRNRGVPKMPRSSKNSFDHQ